MFFKRRRNRDEDEDWGWDDGWEYDDEYALEENGRFPSIKRITLVLPLLLAIMLCGRLVYFRRSAPSTAARVYAPIEEYDPDTMASLMLDLINASRAENGLTAVNWDKTAASAGRLHAEDMVEYDYFSHWNREGLGPEHRYAQAGGQDAVMENLHSFFYTYDDGRAAPIENWQEVIQNAEIGLMNSPGHRANILDPAHTNVGIGMAYNPETGQFRLAQEFTNQYVQIVQPIPVEVELGDVVVVNGRITNNNISNILLDLSHEPFPDSMSIEELDATNTYSSAVESVKTVAVSADFDEQVVVGGGGAGFYHIRIFGDLPTGQALLMDRIITVRSLKFCE